MINVEESVEEREILCVDVIDLFVDVQLSVVI